jgi:hypothetical protein
MHRTDNVQKVFGQFVQTGRLRPADVELDIHCDWSSERALIAPMQLIYQVLLGVGCPILSPAPSLLLRVAFDAKVARSHRPQSPPDLTPFRTAQKAFSHRPSPKPRPVLPM